MKRFRIEITELAEADLENAGDYIAYKLLNPHAAIDTVQGIRRQINSLEKFPERNKLEDDPVLAGLGIRRDYYKNYKIYYIIDSEKQIVYIIRILHMLEDSSVWLYRTFGLR